MGPVEREAALAAMTKAKLDGLEEEAGEECGGGDPLLTRAPQQAKASKAKVMEEVKKAAFEAMGEEESQLLRADEEKVEKIRKEVRAKVMQDIKEQKQKQKKHNEEETAVKKREEEIRHEEMKREDHKKKAKQKVEREKLAEEAAAFQAKQHAETIAEANRVIQANADAHARAQAHAHEMKVTKMRHEERVRREEKAANDNRQAKYKEAMRKGKAYESRQAREAEKVAMTQAYEDEMVAKVDLPCAPVSLPLPSH